MSVADKYCKPNILVPGKEIQEKIYQTCLTYAKILCGNESPWDEWSMDLYRAELHDSIAKYCDCDKELVANAFEFAFSSLKRSEVDFYRRPIDDDFLKLVDKWIEELKEIARLPEETRLPISIPNDCEINVDGIPNIGVKE